MLSTKGFWALQEGIAWGGAATALGALYYIFYGRNKVDVKGERSPVLTQMRQQGDRGGLCYARHRGVTKELQTKKPHQGSGRFFVCELINTSRPYSVVQS
jgi:hypothetical protein